MSDESKQLPDSVEALTEEMEQTRSGLADKLEALGRRISGTVEDVEETVETVVETTQDTISTIKNTFNISKQVEERPWIIMGCSVLVGFLGGKLLGQVASRPNGHRDSYANGAAESMTTQMASTSAFPTGTERQTDADRHTHRDTNGHAEGGWLQGLKDQFGPEISKAKGLAVGALFGVVRDLVSQALPEALKKEVTHWFDNVTEKAGGEPIQAGSFAEQPSAESASQESAMDSSSRREPPTPSI